MISPHRVPDWLTPRERLLAADALAAAELDHRAVRALVDVADGGRVVVVRGVQFAPDDEVPLARAIHAAVQALPYVPDPDGEWLQGGAWTATYGGDCEDLHALGRRLFLRARLAAETLWLLQRLNEQDHVALRARVVGRWFWAECTIPALFGESPFAAVERLRGTGVELRPVM